MNLHIFPDDKFIDEFITIANSVNPNSNTFIVNASKPLRYVKSQCVYIAEYGSQEFDAIAGDLSQYRRVYIHFLTDAMCHFINNHADNNFILFWVFWGADLYKYIPYPLLDETTLLYLKTGHYKISSGLLGAIRSRIAKQHEHSERARAIKKLAYVLHFDEDEYKLILRYFPTKAKYQYFSYPNLLQLDYLDQPTDISVLKAVAQDIGMKLDKKIVLLGNSGWETGNHLSVLQGFAANKRDDYQVVVPLSYGNPEYIEYVIRQGKRLLGNKFVPLTTFLAPQTYSQLIKVVDYGIFNSRRTQGVGNIIALLYIGKKVFLNPMSTYYHFLNRKGVTFSSIDLLFSKVIEPLDSTSGEKNREIIRGMYSNKSSEETIRMILNIE